MIASGSYETIRKELDLGIPVIRTNKLRSKLAVFFDLLMGRHGHKQFIITTAKVKEKRNKTRPSEKKIVEVWIRRFH